MQESNILLSISLLVSGRKETKKCLDSLKPLLDQIPSELILTDTGCDAETRALIEQYTDKIYEFTWCKDFAKARNVGLNAARGEWFLYLDDDEWFGDTIEIVKFFQSGEYKKYNSAIYTQRNYQTMAGNVYDNVGVSRMVKRYKDVTFCGKIHEYLTPWRAPVKQFNTFVHHYGYVYRNNQEKRAHAFRNIEPLLEMISESKGDIRLTAQLVQEYYCVNEYEKVVEAARKGITDYYHYGDVDDDHNVLLGAVYGYLLLSLEILARYDEANEWIVKGLTIENITASNRAFLYMAGARIAYRQQQYKQAIDYYKKYIVLFERYKDDIDVIRQGGRLLVENVFFDSLTYPLFQMVGICALCVQDFVIAKDALFRLDWSVSGLLHQEETETQIIDAVCEAEFDQTSVDILQKLVSRPGGMREMYPLFLQKEMELAQEKDTEKLSKLHRVVAAIDYSHRYIAYTRILVAAEETSEEKKVVLTGLFSELFAKFPQDIIEIKDDIWEIAERYEIAVEPMLLQIDFNTWQLQVESWSKECGSREACAWNNRLQKWKKVDDIRYTLFDMTYLEICLREARNSLPNLSQLENQMEEFAEKVIGFYQPYYKEFVFTEAPMMLSMQAQVALRFLALCDARRNGTDNDVINALKDLKGFYAPMDDMLAYYSNLFKEEVRNRNNEMELMANKLKGTARVLIANGSGAEALNIINQLLVWFPEDKELHEMKRQL